MNVPRGCRITRKSYTPRLAFGHAFWKSHSPRRRPIRLFFSRFHAEVEPTFILITHWNHVFQGITEPSDNSCSRCHSRCQIQPRFVSYCFTDRHSLDESIENANLIEERMYNISIPQCSLLATRLSAAGSNRYNGL